MRNIKPIRRLYFQFGCLTTPKLDAHECFSALESAGLVIGVAWCGGQATHYRETERLTEISETEFEAAISAALKGYLCNS